MIFGAIYVLSAIGCWLLVYVGFKGMRADWMNVYYSTSLIPGVAGFSVFPGINTMICLVLGLWLATRHNED